MSSLFGNLLSSAESAAQNAITSVIGPGQVPPPGVPPGPSIVANSPAAAAAVPGIVPPPPPGMPPPAGMVPVYAPVKKGLWGEIEALPTPIKLGGAALVAWLAWELVLKDRL